MKWNNFFKYLAIATIMIGALVPTLNAAERDADDFYLIPRIQKANGWLAEYIPTTLTHGELQQLKSGQDVEVTRRVSNRDLKVILKSIGPVTDGTTLASHLPSRLRPITNWMRGNNDAASLVGIAPIEGEDRSKFFAFYALSSNITLEFPLEGRVPDLHHKIVHIADIDEEAKDDSPLPLARLINPLSSQLRFASDDLQIMLQQSITLASLDSLDIGAPLPQGSPKLYAACANGGQHVFSFLAKPLVTRLPVVNFLHPKVELLAKTLGYSTVTHMLADIIQNGKLNSKLLESEQATSIVPAERTSQRLHATSRFFGYLASLFPGVSVGRTLLTLRLNRQGYATITHWAMGVKDLDLTEMADLYTAPRLAQEGVALAVETFVPLGNVLVAVSQTGAQIFLQQPSLTAYAIKKIGHQTSQDKQA